MTSEVDEQRVAVERVIEVAGGQSALAEKLSVQIGKRVGQSTISMWLFRGRVPHNWVIPVEAVLCGKMKRNDIRSDLHPRDHDA